MFICIIFIILFFHGNSAILNDSLKPRGYMRKIKNRTFAFNILLAHIETKYFLTNTFLTYLIHFYLIKIESL